MYIIFYIIVLIPICPPVGFIYPVTRLIDSIRLKRPDITTIVDCSRAFNMIEPSKYSTNIDYIFSENIYPLIHHERVPFVIAKKYSFLI